MFNTFWEETAGRCVLQNRRYDGKVMFILYEAKANQAKGKFLSAELFFFKLLVKLEEDINEIWKNCVGKYKMAHFTTTIWHTIPSDISSNKPDTNNFIFNPNITQKNLAEVVRYVKTLNH